MGWKNLAVDAGFGGGEETMRFGPRNEKGSSLYQVDTLACISQGEEEEVLLQSFNGKRQSQAISI